MVKTNSGRFFEDYAVGQTINHAAPRTVGQGERALYQALYPARHALYSSDLFAQACGLRESPLDDLLAFHVVFGKTVPDVSLNAVANLGYAEGRWRQPVYVGDTLRSSSEVIGLKQNSSGKTGVVYVRTCGMNQRDEIVIEFVRWVMVRKRNIAEPAPEAVVPKLIKAVDPKALIIPDGLNFSNYDFDLAGETHRWGDYSIGEVIDHVDGVTLEEAEHMMATRLWQNTAKVHFDATFRPDGKRLIYGGHIMSLARTLSFNGLANAQIIVGLNGGAHANPAFSGLTIRAWSEVLDKAETVVPGVGAIRLRLVATRGGSPFERLDSGGKYLSDVLLDLDYWALMPV
ncbi:MaoC family dehydratase [Pseudopelagicola sp. nBUS_19]|uniref:MaoC family dehydratase n=1 Tax=Pseudopelagicola sp. nBUS_19 TaxID=3395316 RepID=UPI003EB98DB0